MPKNIILCSDGTANAGGNGDVSNVWRIYNAIDLANTGSITQLAMHDDGVGNAQFFPLRLLGRAFGYGLKRNVRDLYHFLIRNYQPGADNHIYIFGFSRGAYTARVLTELICLCGIVNPKNKTDAQVNREINEAFEILTESILDSSPNTTFISRLLARGMRSIKGIKLLNRQEFMRSRCHPIELIQGRENSMPYLIRFVGIWDTVSAYGFPVEWMANFWNNYIYPFKFSDRRLHRYVRKAAHALAVDEERETFGPMLFDQSPDRNQGLPADRVEQVWFPGVHANVGGGYPKDGLAYISLNWMMDKAEQTIDGQPGLKFITPMRDEYASRINPSAKMYDSRAGLALFYRYNPRDIVKLSIENGIDTTSSDPARGIRIHPSVLQRVTARTKRYAPGNIPSTAVLEGKSAPAEIRNIMQRYKDTSATSMSHFGDVEPLIKLRRDLQKFKLVMLALLALVAFKDRLTAKLHHLDWLSSASVISECTQGILAPINDFMIKLTPFIPYGEWLQTTFLTPILNCDSIALIFIGGGLGLWCVGYRAKQIIIKNHSNFWQRFLG